MIDEHENDWVAEELALVQARRDRLVEARDANPHIDHHTGDEQLAILDRQLRDLREQAA